MEKLTDEQVRNLPEDKVRKALTVAADVMFLIGTHDAFVGAWMASLDRDCVDTLLVGAAQIIAQNYETAD